MRPRLVMVSSVSGMPTIAYNIVTTIPADVFGAM